MPATIIDETFGDSVDPDSLKIVAVKFVMATTPENWFKAIKQIPYMMALRACLVSSDVENKIWLSIMKIWWFLWGDSHCMELIFKIKAFAEKFTIYLWVSQS